MVIVRLANIGCGQLWVTTQDEMCLMPIFSPDLLHFWGQAIIVSTSRRLNLAWSKRGSYCIFQCSVLFCTKSPLCVCPCWAAAGLLRGHNSDNEPAHNCLDKDVANLRMLKRRVGFCWTRAFSLQRTSCRSNIVALRRDCFTAGVDRGNDHSEQSLFQCTYRTQV